MYIVKINYISTATEKKQAWKKAPANVQRYIERNKKPKERDREKWKRSELGVARAKLERVGPPNQDTSFRALLPNMNTFQHNKNKEVSVM